MTSTIGNYSLSAAILVAAITLLVSLAAVRFGSQGLRRTVRRGIYALAALLTLASGALLLAEINSDFSIKYVASYTERALPFGYKLAAFWAGQAGSVLLWAWVVAIMAAVYVFWNRKQEGAEQSAAAGVLAVIIAFFAALMLFADANPFETLSPVPVDGHGMNPMLQNIGMIAHPPILFLGYAGYTIPFAMLLGALFANKLGETWVRQARAWSIIAWLFLSAGILIGSWWAYVELNFGGYWAWDPVENASLLPWLTGTALLHCLIAQRQRGTFKIWTAGMIGVSFLLCIFAAYITRGGVVNSVHGFGKSKVGDTLFVTLVLSTLLTAGMISLRWKLLRGDRPLDGLLSRDGGFMAGNILFLGMMLITLLGTLYPVVREMLGQPRMEVQKSFYNRAVLPLGLGMVALMAVGPLLTYGKESAGRLARGLAFPLMAAGVVVVGLALAGIQELWMLAGAVVLAVFFVVLVTDWIGSALARSRKNDENIVVAAMGLIGANRRRYGGHLVHVGVALVVLGIVATSLYRIDSDTPVLAPGQSMQVGPYTVTVQSIDEIKGPNYDAMQATLIAARGSERMELKPQVNWYPKWTDEDGHPQPISKVSIHSGWKCDLWSVMGVDRAGCSFKVVVMPLMAWLWVGGALMGMGTLVTLLPQSGRAAEAAAEQSPAEAIVAATPSRRRGRPVAPAGQAA